MLTSVSVSVGSVLSSVGSVFFVLFFVVSVIVSSVFFDFFRAKYVTGVAIPATRMMPAITYVSGFCQMLFFFFSVKTTGAGLTAFAAAGTVPVLLYEDGLYCGAILFAAGADAYGDRA